MMRDKVERMADYRQSSDNTAEVENIDLSDTTIGKASAERYERRSKIRNDFKQVNRWIAVSLYLILVGIALVIF